MCQPVRIMLSGGPDGTPPTWNVESLESETRVLIRRGNGYEHFEFADRYAEYEGEKLPVYDWSYRTCIAE
ncbi:MULTISPECIES: DUF5988 family protein [unclassified Streptomyces]|uniref:DUF5988 family protein n=1 Tax=unclassified Streptomyces TaxID=2593676 RepID=UPI00081DF42C|nr:MULTISPECIES: DUF5988 family protein [unclassified Streptomyces]SCF70197.1 hypothetical protein GA0115259_101256 [Streptomyces sp. MnatMP-M17]